MGNCAKWSHQTIGQYMNVFHSLKERVKNRLWRKYKNDYVRIIWRDEKSQAISDNICLQWKTHIHKHTAHSNPKMKGRMKKRSEQTKYIYKKKKQHQKMFEKLNLIFLRTSFLST